MEEAKPNKQFTLTRIGETPEEWRTKQKKVLRKLRKVDRDFEWLVAVELPPENHRHVHAQGFAKTTMSESQFQRVAREVGFGRSQLHNVPTPRTSVAKHFAYIFKSLDSPDPVVRSEFYRWNAKGTKIGFESHTNGFFKMPDESEAVARLEELRRRMDESKEKLASTARFNESSATNGSAAEGDDEEVTACAPRASVRSSEPLKTPPNTITQSPIQRGSKRLTGGPFRIRKFSHTPACLGQDQCNQVPRGFIRTLLDAWRRFVPDPKKSRKRSKPEFWDNVIRTDDLIGCWMWTGPVTRDGYGMFWWRHPVLGDRIREGAHRIAFYKTYGWLPETVMHSCDERSCVRPEHLQAGTHADNMRDAMLKGRMATGPRSRFTTQQVVEIRGRAASGILDRQLADMYGVHFTTISHLVLGKTYRDYPGPIREPRWKLRGPRKHRASPPGSRQQLANLASAA